MKFTEQNLNGVYTIEPEPYTDDRGLLRRHFCQREYGEHNLMTEIMQTNISENRKKNTLRGFHFQKRPYGENKIISCIKGRIFDIIVDMRQTSSTYLKWQSFELTEENRLSLYVPVGCANAYLTQDDNTWILYYHSEFYTAHAESGIRYNDRFFNFNWPCEPKIISEKDLKIPDFCPTESL